jgi:hypothetical protein
MYTPLGTVCILFEIFLVSVKMRELFEVAGLGGTLCISIYRKGRCGGNALNLYSGRFGLRIILLGFRTNGGIQHVEISRIFRCYVQHMYLKQHR